MLGRWRRPPSEPPNAPVETFEHNGQEKHVREKANDACNDKSGRIGGPQNHERKQRPRGAKPANPLKGWVFGKNRNQTQCGENCCDCEEPAPVVKESPRG